MSSESNIYAFRPPDKPETQRKALKDQAQQDADFKKTMREVKIYIVIGAVAGSFIASMIALSMIGLAWLFSPIP